MQTSAAGCGTCWPPAPAPTDRTAAAPRTEARTPDWIASAPDRGRTPEPDAPWVAPSRRPLDQLHGVVIDRDRWVPVAGASLRIVARLPQTRGTIAARDDHAFQADVRTDAEGRFAVDAPAGRYRIFASTEEGLRGLLATSGKPFFIVGADITEFTSLFGGRAP